MEETEGKSLARSVLGQLYGSHLDESTYPTQTEKTSRDTSNDAANNALDATKALQADSVSQQKPLKVDSKMVFFSMQPDDFEYMFREADKDSSNSLSKEELEEFKTRSEKEPHDAYSPRFDQVAQLLLENYDQARELVKSNYGIFDDRFSAKHFKSDPVTGMLSRQDFDMVKMFSGNGWVEDYSSDNHQSEWQRNSRACFLFAATGSSISAAALLSKRIPLLSVVSLGIGALTAGLATHSLLNDHPMLREYKQRQNMFDSWELQTNIKTEK